VKNMIHGVDTAEHLVMRVQWPRPDSPVEAAIYPVSADRQELILTTTTPQAMQELIDTLRWVCQDMEDWMEERGL
jgi:hypothetical protein